MIKRNVSILKQQQLNAKFDNDVNIWNLEKLSKWRAYLLIKKYSNQKNDLRIYLHNLISKWYIKQPETIHTLKQLQKIIIKYKLKLNHLENSNVLLLEERYFNNDRILKHIEIKSDLLKGEYVYAKYTYGSVFIRNDNSSLILKKIAVGDLIISNKRIFIQNFDLINVIFYFDKIKSIWFTTYGLKIKYFNDHIYVFRIHDSISLNNIFLNIIKKKAKSLLKMIK